MDMSKRAGTLVTRGIHIKYMHSSLAELEEKVIE